MYFLREFRNADDVRTRLLATADQLKDAYGNAFCLFQTKANDDSSGVDSNVSFPGVIFLESNVDHHSTSNFESHTSGIILPQCCSPNLCPVCPLRTRRDKIIRVALTLPPGKIGDIRCTLTRGLEIPMLTGPAACGACSIPCTG
jgi:hypothetical protein